MKLFTVVDVHFEQPWLRDAIDLFVSDVQRALASFAVVDAAHLGCAR